MSFTKTVVAICGPTAAGKTALAIETARQYGTEIISADSRQCFRELNIGVAKPSPEELNEVKHHFINSYSIFDVVNAAVFAEDALEASEKIFSKNPVVVLAGGTGLYIKAFLEGLDDIPVGDAAIRFEIEQGYSKGGLEWLRNALIHEDPRFAQEGEMQNPQRMMRALAVKRFSGKSILDYHGRSKISRDFTIRKILLDPPRAALYKAIDLRVEQMLEAGLLDEVAQLHPHKNLPALQTVGYTELFEFLEGRRSLDEAIDLIKRNTRRYAKRQLTWFKKYFIDDATEVRSFG